MVRSRRRRTTSRNFPKPRWFLLDRTCVRCYVSWANPSMVAAEADSFGGSAVSHPRVESFSFTPSTRIAVTLSELRRHAAWRRPLRQQIIVPFLLLLVFVAVVGISALTYQATSAGMAGFDQSLLRA